MKAAANGVLNVSILGGWWDEAYDPSIGWAIGNRETYNNHHYQNNLEASMLYDILEHEIVPLFYARSTDDLPVEWIERMKRSTATYCGQFSSHRMVREYAERIYMPAAQRAGHLSSDGMKRLRALSAWQRRIHEA